MRSRILKSLAIITAVSLVGIFIGAEVTQSTVVNAQTEARERSFAAVQASWLAMEMLRGDLQRAGYYQESAVGTGLQMQAAGSAPWRVEQAGRDTLRLRSPDGREWITYRFAGGQLVRGNGRSEKVLLQRITDFRFQIVREGSVINLALAVGVAPEYNVASSSVHFSAHFRLAKEG